MMNHTDTRWNDLLTMLSDAEYDAGDRFTTITSRADGRHRFTAAFLGALAAELVTVPGGSKAWETAINYAAERVEREQ